MLALAQCALVALLAVWLLVLRWPLGYPPEWVWQASAMPTPMHGLFGIARALLASGVLVGAALWMRQRGTHPRFWTAATLLLLVGSVFLCQVALSVGYPGGMAWAVASQFSPVASEYFDSAFRLEDPVSYCRDYLETMRHAGYHLATHPPGMVLLHWVFVVPARDIEIGRALATRFAEGVGGMSLAELGRFARRYPGAAQLPDGAVPAAAAAAVAPSLFGALSLIPLFALVRRLTDISRALWVALLFATAPSLLLLGQCADQWVLFISMVLAWLAVEGITRDHWVWFAAAGVVAGLGTAVTFGFLTCCVAVGVLAVVLSPSRPTVRRLAIRAVAFASGFAGAWALVSVTLGVNLIAVCEQGLNAHARATLGPQRTHAVWAWLNFVELALFLGLPVAARVASMVWAQLKLWSPRRPMTAGLALAVAGLSAMVLPSALGLVRGEVGRIWLFLMPLLVAGALPAPGPGQPANEVPPWLAMTASLQIAQVLLMAAVMLPMVRPY
ncbi:MAG TPA: glycosyltransferase family 39 protein [Armatimonadota bacterium]|nr:glycosyltransferase family 39 protein [Armatimonadota bacterium]